MAELVTMRGLTYRYPDADEPALRDVDLELCEGEFVVVAGRSGSGKSSLLRACCGLIPHYHGGDVSGSLEVCGLDVHDAGPAELGGIVGLVGQDPESQVVSATVRGELELALELRGEGATSSARAIEEVTLALGIADLVDRPVETLSGGELQRVALAAALVLRPRLVLLDEPTSQLDPVAGEELIGLLRRLNEEWGMAVVLAEHRLDRCLAAADRVLAFDGGALVHDGSPQDFCDWVAEADPALAPPGVRLFQLAGLRPLPVSAKAARKTLAARPQKIRRSSETGPRSEENPSIVGFSPVGGSRRRPGRGPRARENAALSCRDLWIDLDSGSGPTEVLRELELALEPGERVALMGRNGAGKSTLLRAAAGLLKPARGSIATPRGCALLPQSPGDLLVRERVGDELPGEAGLRALAAVGLEAAVDADPRDLSGGERERLALAVVMAGRENGGAPGLVCLDEPTRGMDGARKAELGTWLAELAAGGAAVLVATHDVEFATIVATRVVLLGDGVLIADGGVDEILSGGWYFATEVARILGAAGAVTPEQGAALLRGLRSSGEAAVDAGSDLPSLSSAQPPETGAEGEDLGGGVLA